jgi:hypothetical protein
MAAIIGWSRDASRRMGYAWIVMTVRNLLCLLAALGLVSSCSGKTTTAPEGGGGSSGSSGTGGNGGTLTDAGTCPPDFEVRTGLAACQAVAPGCLSGACVRGHGVWVCAPACPCEAGWFCTWFGDKSGCVPEAFSGCANWPDGGPGGTGGFSGTGGSGGTGGTGGIGGTGGTGGIGGSGGIGGTGGTSGTGGTGPCGGDPACYGGEASFCSTDGLRLLSCKSTDDCPEVTHCVSFCPKCTCHMSPPINGVLRGTCDTCTSDAECTGTLLCREHPMFPGSGAKTCVAP